MKCRVRVALGMIAMSSAAVACTDAARSPLSPADNQLSLKGGVVVVVAAAEEEEVVVRLQLLVVSTACQRPQRAAPAPS
jgi:hypothetical protein